MHATCKDIWRAESVSLASLALVSASSLPAGAETRTTSPQLADDGFDVIGATRSGEALDLVERACPALVLAGGLDLCARLREGEPGRKWNRDVPVIVFADPDADFVDRVRAFERGADDVLERPIVYMELWHAFAPAPPPRLASARVIERRDRPTVDPASARRGCPSRSREEFERAAKLAGDRQKCHEGRADRRSGAFAPTARIATLDSHASRLRRKLAQQRAEDAAGNVGGWATGCWTTSPSSAAAGAAPAA